MTILRFIFLILYFSCSVYAKADTPSAGFYTGTFDPPTRAHFYIIQEALNKFHLDKLTVVVNVDGEKDTLTSVVERINMLRLLTSSFGDKIEVVGANKEERNSLKGQLIEKYGKNHLFQFIGEDSFEKLPESALNASAFAVLPRNGSSALFNRSLPTNVQVLSVDPNLMNLSSSLARKKLQNQENTDEVLTPEVRAYIEKYRLYGKLNPALLKLEKALFEEGFHMAVEDVLALFPNSDTQLDIPAFLPGQSELRWTEKFREALLKHYSKSTQSLENLRKTIENILRGWFEAHFYGKLPHLSKVYSSKNVSRSIIGQITLNNPFASDKAAPADYNIDITTYTSDRFPKALQNYLKAEHGEVWVHDGWTEASLEYHRSEGYNEVYKVQTRRGQPHRYMFVALHANKPPRLILTEVRSQDRKANVLRQLFQTGVFDTYQQVEHHQKMHLFEFNEFGQNLKLTDSSQIIIGYKNDWARLLNTENGWSRQPLTKSGLDIELFTHSSSGQQIVLARNVYGDDILSILKPFYQKGARRFLYMGSAGAINTSFQIGDILVPSKVTTEKATVNLQNSLPNIKGLSDGLTIHENVHHSSVQTVYDETNEKLRHLSLTGVQSVDIEGGYIAKFTTEHPDAYLNMMLVVSDQTTGAATLEQSNAFSKIIDQSIETLISRIAPTLKEISARTTPAKDLSNFIAIHENGGHPSCSAIFK